MNEWNDKTFEEQKNSMDARTLKGLKEEIAKFDRICHGVDVIDYDEEWAGSALCALFQDPDCGDCPVSWYKDELWADPCSGCGGTPIIDFIDCIAVEGEVPYSIVGSEDIPAACDSAEKAVEFLISLLPKKVKKSNC